MNKVYNLLLLSLVFLTFKGYGQNRAVTVLLHETFETGSKTLSSWTSTPSSGCTAYNWTAKNSSGQGALGSAGYWLYQSSAATSGCYASAYTPLFVINKVDNSDTVTVDFYMYRETTSSTDHISVVITDQYNSPVYGPFSVFADDTKTPVSGAGWYHFTWNINYVSNIYNNVTVQGFKVGFTGISDHGVDLLLDEVTVSHSYTHSAGIAPLNSVNTDFSCYPNPTHNSLNLHFSDALSENTILNVYNMNGKQVLTRSIPSGSSEASIDIHDILSGLYILEVKNNLSVSRKEVVVN